MIRLAACLACLALAACATPPRSYRVPPGPYGEALVESTRALTIYRSIELVLMAHATRETPRLRSTRTAHLASVYRVSAAEAEQRVPLLVQPLEGHVFFVSVYTARRAWNDLERADSPWTLSLAGPAGEARPLSVARVPRTTPAVQELFPYTDQYTVSYRVAFPDSVGNGPLRLTIAGPLGSAAVDF